MSEEYTLEVLLRQVGKIHSNKVNEVLDEYSMHKGQPLLLHLLDMEKGLPQSVLAKEMQNTPATVSAMVKRMEKNGFVVRKRDSIDERVSNVYLTEKGKEMEMKLRGLRTEMEKMVFANFSDDEKKNMRVYLERVLKNLEN